MPIKKLYLVESPGALLMVRRNKRIADGAAKPLAELKWREQAVEQACAGNARPAANQPKNMYMWGI
jgi:hypothetical protein